MFFLFYLPLKTNNIGTKNKEKPLETEVSNGFFSVTGGIRTPDRPLRRRMLYPAELL